FHCPCPLERGSHAAEHSLAGVGAQMILKHHQREVSVAIAITVLTGILAISASGYFARSNLRDLFLANIPVMVVALGMTLVILTGQIDISVGSIFAICGVAAGVLAKT